jgi:tartrate dehydratase alpha subunit/fumarate hydratase class I-like protein
MMRLDSRMAKELVNKIRNLLQEKSYRVANNVRNKVNAVMDPEAAANGAVVNKKLISAREWYEEFTGIDLVRAAQERVVVVK